MQCAPYTQSAVLRPTTYLPAYMQSDVRTAPAHRIACNFREEPDLRRYNGLQPAEAKVRSQPRNQMVTVGVVMEDCREQNTNGSWKRHRHPMKCAHVVPLPGLWTARQLSIGHRDPYLPAVGPVMLAAVEASKRPLRRSRRRPGVLVFLLWFGALTAWSLATPVWASPDEFAHAFRAYSAVHGQVYVAPVHAFDGTGGFVTALRGWLGSVHHYRCVFRPNTDANCLPPLTNDRHPVRVASTSCSLNPLYYLAVGSPSLLAGPAHAIAPDAALERSVIGALPQLGIHRGADSAPAWIGGVDRAPGGDTDGAFSRCRHQPERP